MRLRPVPRGFIGCREKVMRGRSILMGGAVCFWFWHDNVGKDLLCQNRFLSPIMKTFNAIMRDGCYTESAV